MAGGPDDANAFRWVDDYIAHVRPHFEVRSEDSLLIVMPNKAVKLNASGLAILRFLKDGGSIERVLERVGGRSDRRRQLFWFLCDFRSLMSGCLGEGRGREAVDVVSHAAMPFNALPVLSEIAVTYRCNLRCRFCYAACGCQGARGSMDEMTTRQVVRVLKIIRRDAKVPSVSFTGGEPALREDLEELVAAARATGLRTNLITNGTLLAGNDLARRLRRAGLTSAQVSLEGPTADVHDGLTGVAGSFARTREGLQALRQAGIHTHTNTTINALNADHLEGLVRLIADLGITRMSANMVIPAGSAADRRVQVPYSRIGEVVLRVREAARRYGVEFLWYSPTPMCIFNPLAMGMGNKSCAACDGLLSVSPAGDVLPCSSYPEPVGNLLDQPFEEIWSSARAVFFRHKDYAPSECAGCEDFVACAGGCPLYWSAMGTAELSEARRLAHAVA
jgi:radical SAM protein with 4Fe4S-binding SPASM domain